VARFDQPIEPMTLGNMRELGVRSLFVSCWNCHHQAVPRRRSLAGRHCGARLRAPYSVHQLRHRRRGRPAELERAAAAGDPDRSAMAMLNDDETRSLEALARAPDGCAEAVLLTDGFTIKQLSGLVIDGFATLERRRTNVGGRERPVLWIQITAAGRKAIG
jgi:hypothetical protein